MNKDKFLVKDGNRAEWGVPEGYPYKEETQKSLLPEQDVSFSRGQGAIVADTMDGIPEGSVLHITFDGTVYDCVTICPVPDVPTVYVAGNLGLIDDSSYEDTGEPFGLLYQGDGTA